MTENSILRLAMVLGDSTASTLDNYICKLVEVTLYDASEPTLELAIICERILENFGLMFDADEVRKAIKRKHSGRISWQNEEYSISAKVANQLATLADPMELLKTFISEFARVSGIPFNEEHLFDCLQRYIYYRFNSTKKNLMSLLQNTVVPVDEAFSPSDDDRMLINDFILWDNDDKNKLLTSIVISSFEYCMLTTKQDTLLSRKIFRGKRFLLDTNIVFRMAGVNKDERKFVADSFVEKCTEVGIDLCYTNETFSELLRVINSQTRYIRGLTQGQPPISIDLMQKIDDRGEPNDFYELYYNWAKNLQNRYNDFESFQRYLIDLITSTLSDLKMVSIDNQKYGKNDDTFDKMCDSLRRFKHERRPSRQVPNESLQADVNNILYTKSLREKAQSQTFWQVNDFFVSADQILATWAEQTYPGIPIVVIPSTWLSIILRFSGRTSNDYKSYCLFMTLRQPRSNVEPAMNPVLIMSALAKKTSDVTLKERIITELVSNKAEYSFDAKEEYDPSVEKAFDKIVADLKAHNETVVAETTSELCDEFQRERDELDQRLAGRASEEEYIFKYAQNKADRKVDKFKKLPWLQPTFPFLGIGVAVAAVISYFFQIPPIYLVFLRLGTALSFVLTSTATAIPLALAGALKYLSSDERRKHLVETYRAKAKKDMEYK